MFAYMVSLFRVFRMFYSYDHFFALGESEYWLATVKVLMIIIFIFVGLIYDWGGIKNHPGPVSSLPFLKRYRGRSPFPCTGSIQLSRLASICRWFFCICSDIRIRLLFVRWNRASRSSCRRVRETLQSGASCNQSHLLPNPPFLHPDNPDDRPVHKLPR